MEPTSARIIVEENQPHSITPPQEHLGQRYTHCRDTEKKVNPADVRNSRKVLICATFELFCEAARI